MGSDFPGMGVMIGMLGGNKDTIENIKLAIGKTIKKIVIVEDGPNSDNADELRIWFKDDTGVKIFDGGQSCCESRYMKTDDDLDYHVGSVLRDISSADGSSTEDGEWGDVHDIQFLIVETSLGRITCSNHNEHNGYYGGFWLEVEQLND